MFLRRRFLGFNIHPYPNKCVCCQENLMYHPQYLNWTNNKGKISGLRNVLYRDFSYCIKVEIKGERKFCTLKYDTDEMVGTRQFSDILNNITKSSCIRNIYLKDSGNP